MDFLFIITFPEMPVALAVCLFNRSRVIPSAMKNSVKKIKFPPVEKFSLIIIIKKKGKEEVDI